MVDLSARANPPSTMRSSRRSNPRMATATQITGAPRGSAAGGGDDRPAGKRDGGRLGGRAIVSLLSLGRVAELADALASGASGRKVVGGQVPPRPRFSPFVRRKGRQSARFGGQNAGRAGDRAPKGAPMADTTAADPVGLLADAILT